MERRKLVSLGNSAARVEARAKRSGRTSRHTVLLLAVMVLFAAIVSRYGGGSYAQEITSQGAESPKPTSEFLETFKADGGSVRINGESNFNVTGTLTTSDAEVIRPSSCGALSTVTTRFDAIPFTVTTPGDITLSLEAADGGSIIPNGTDGAGPDTFLILYNGTFSAATPLTGCLSFNDDVNGSLNRRSRILTNLALGSYTAVITSFAATPTTTTGDAALPWTYSLAINGGASTNVTGTAGSDTIVVTRSGANTIVNLNSVQVLNQATAGLTALTINGLSGDDTLTIDASGGNPFPSARGITFDGGTQADSITLQGGSFSTGTSTPSGQSFGALVYSGGTTGAATLNYANLELITDTNVADAYTINGTAANNTINLVTGPGAALQVNSGATPTFGLINFSNKTNVTVNALAGADTVNILARTGISVLTISGNEGDDRLDAGSTTAGAGEIRLNGNANNDTLIGGGDDDTLDGGADDDIIFGNGGTDNVGGGAPDGPNDIISVPGTLAGDSISLAISAGNLVVSVNSTSTTYRNFVGGPIASSGIDRVSVNSDAGNDTVTVSSTEATLPTDIATGANDDSVIFADGVLLNGGTINGGTETDTLNYGAYSTAVTVNLGLGTTGLNGTLDGLQENPSQNTIATGTAAVSNYNAVTKTFDVAVTVTDLNPALVTGFHIHRAPVGVNGPVIIDLLPLGALTPAGTGFTFNVAGVLLPLQHESAFLGGITYINIHTSAAPGGLIRGQLFSNANVNLASGTATGTNSISGIENVIGGGGADSLVGNFVANSLLGGTGGDTLVGGPGSDTFNGGANSDVLVWSNGDGTDVMEGGADADTVQVNGSLTANDVFTVGAGAGGRVAFSRVSPGPFSLDVGTTESLRVNGIVGDDTFTVSSLVGVSDLSLVSTAGFDGNDIFNITPAPNGTTRTINVHGGLNTPVGDSLNIDRTGVANPLLTLDASGNGSFTSTSHQTINIVGIESPRSRAPFDYDGDNKTDISIFRPGPGEWWVLRSSNGTNFALQFGSSTDKLVPADYTGDNKADVAFWRPSNGNWFILRSEDFTFFAFPFGTNGDVPVPADFDGDNKADYALFRPSTLNWFIQKSTGGTDILTFGAAGDKPVVADYDGDAKADIAIYRPAGASGSEWWVRRSSNGSSFALQFGTPTDRPVQGDFTGDGKADVAFWRPSNGNWFVLRSEDFSFFAFPFGANGDVPVPGDYDGDGKFDAGVFRPSNLNWFVQRSTAGTLIQAFGAAGDIPTPSVYVP